MSEMTPPFYPIIYVRGYAGGDAEINDAVADPYMGFNIGATSFRQRWTGDVRRHYFESPLYRLTKDFGYRDVYSDGQEMPANWIPSTRSVVIYRYYDEQYFDNLSLTGDIANIEGRRRDIEQFADGLNALIEQLRDRICQTAEMKKQFKVYLVAHSMGGLICRCFLQNSKVGKASTKKLVDKVFTYATPHGGIDFSIIGNVPNFFSLNNVNNFNESRMREYLGFPRNSKNAVNDLMGKFDPDRFFCLVGTNSKDYLVASGWSRRLVGPMSDGLVRIANATVKSTRGKTGQSPRAFVYKSHSGHVGIVNSEDGYQNLVRFLFGHIRVDGILHIHKMALPEKVEKARKKKLKIRASYHFETIVGVRGAEWDLHRRTMSEESAIFRTFAEMFPENGSPRSPFLFSVFLLPSASTDIQHSEGERSLFFSVEVAIQIPEYEIDDSILFDTKIKGFIFRDTLNICATPDKSQPSGYRIDFGFDSQTPLETPHSATSTTSSSGVSFEIPIKKETAPGIEAILELHATPWN